MSRTILATAFVIIISLTFADAQQAGAPDATELAKQTQNPVSSLISLPFQYSWRHVAKPLRWASCR